MDSKLRIWALAARPKTLTTALVPVLVGSAAAYRLESHLVGWTIALALLASLLIQIGTNLVNDVSDAEKGADNAERIGPLRVVAAGLLSGRIVWWGAALCFLGAAAMGWPLIAEGGLFILLIGVTGILSGILYTAGPWPLAYVGLGDFFVMLYFGILAVCGMYYLHAGGLSRFALFAGLQVGSLATVLIAVNNFRDYLTDRKAGKKTLPARFGPRFARAEIATLVALPFLVSFWWMQDGYPWTAFLPWLSIPLAVKLLRGVFTTEPGPVYNQFLARSAGLHLVFGVLLSLGLLLDRGPQ